MMEMTKRFTLFPEVKKGTHSGIWDKQKQHNQGTGDELWLGEVVGMLNEGVIIAKENEQLKQRIEKIDFILDDLNGADYISRDDAIKALNKIDKVIRKR